MKTPFLTVIFLAKWFVTSWTTSPLSQLEREARIMSPPLAWRFGIKTRPWLCALQRMKLSANKHYVA
jgi:hypothetical protein